MGQKMEGDRHESSLIKPSQQKQTLARLNIHHLRKFDVAFPLRQTVQTGITVSALRLPHPPIGIIVQSLPSGYAVFTPTSAQPENRPYFEGCADIICMIISP